MLTRQTCPTLLQPLFTSSAPLDCEPPGQGRCLVSAALAVGVCWAPEGFVSTPWPPNLEGNLSLVRQAGALVSLRAQP